MIKLEIENSYTKITGLSPEHFKDLRRELSYKVDYATAQFIPDPSKHIKYCIDLKGNFGTGLLYRVVKWLHTNNLQAKYKMDPLPTFKRLKVDLKVTKGLSPYPDQEDAVEAAIGGFRGILTMPTGTGKSFVIAMLIARLKLKTLIIVPNLTLKEQLLETLKEQLTSLDGIVVENIDSSRLENLKDFDCLIIDEAHHVAAKTYHKLNKKAWNGITHRYFFTATPFRNDNEETLLFETIAGKVIYRLSYSEAVNKGYIVPIDPYYIEIPKQFVEGYTYREVYNELVVNNPERNLIISSLLKNLQDTDQHVLCLVKEIEHGKKLAELSGVHFAYGEDAESRKYLQEFAKGRINALIATTGIAGEGTDTKPCSWVLIAGLGKAKSAFMQSCGRAVRKYLGKDSAKIILFKDKSHRWTIRHYNEQKKILKEEYQAVPTLLDL